MKSPNFRNSSLNPLSQQLADGACFAAGTLVHTINGLVPIEEIKVGDLVLTWPEDMPIPDRDHAPFRLEEEYIYKPVTKIYVNEDQMISHVTVLGYGNPGDDEVLRVTPNHPIWSKRSGWVQAGVLKFGHTLLRAAFSDTLVRRAKHDVERVTVYNIEVKDCHTYFVGKMGIWVHNCGEVLVPIPRKMGSGSNK